MNKKDQIFKKLIEMDRKLDEIRAESITDVASLKKNLMEKLEVRGTLLQRLDQGLRPFNSLRE